MRARKLQRGCWCEASIISLPSTLLVLSWILPSSSFAQLSSLPSATLAITPVPSPTTAPSTQTIPDSPAETSEQAHHISNAEKHAYNYYFLIVVAVAVIFCAVILYMTRRRKRKAAIMRSNGQRALAQDVEGWRGRLRAGRVMRSSPTSYPDEGLDERGEAPPPYVPGSKPPSIGATDERRSSLGSRHTMEDVELGDMSRNRHDPPSYDQTNAGHEVDIVDIRRPNAAMTASNIRGSAELY